MTVKYHLSANGPNRELVGVQAEGEGDHIYSEFMAAVADLGLEGVLARATSTAAAAPAVAVAALPTQAIASQRAPEPWGNPPVQPMVPAAVQQQPASATPVCQHGPKTLISSKPGAPKPWQFWGCNARQDDPTKCEKEWVR